MDTHACVEVASVHPGFTEIMTSCDDRNHGYFARHSSVDSLQHSIVSLCPTYSVDAGIGALRDYSVYDTVDKGFACKALASDGIPR